MAHRAKHQANGKRVPDSSAYPTRKKRSHSTRVELSGAEQQQLTDGLQALDLDVDDAALARLQGYIELVRKWNKAINLVSRQDVERFVSRHLLDSLSIAQLVAAKPSAKTALDIGTGGGLPGIPLSIMLPQIHFTLADRSDRKIRFLNQVVRRLDLTNVKPIATDVALLAQQTQRYDVVVSRAVAAPKLLWDLAQPLLAPKGRLILQTQVRAVGHPDDEEQQPATELLGVDAQVTVEPHAFEVPGLQSLHDVLVLSERKPT